MSFRGVDSKKTFVSIQKMLLPTDKLSKQMLFADKNCDRTLPVQQHQKKKGALKMERIRVACLINRRWNVGNQNYDGDVKEGYLVGISTYSEKEISIPVGIVVFDDHSFADVPFEFITEKTEN